MTGAIYWFVIIFSGSSMVIINGTITPTPNISNNDTIISRKNRMTPSRLCFLFNICTNFPNMEKNVFTFFI
ncbi:hypothetical protein IMSAGC022_00331 [Alistipes sp.]|nr:hypothetical protein IMSAGC022_00331 [Alistipes sp.]